MLKINGLRYFLGAGVWTICGKAVTSAALVALLVGCGDNVNEKRGAPVGLEPLEYSRNLRLGNLHGESVAEIHLIVGRDTLVRRFVLRAAGTEGKLPRELSGATILQVPLRNMVALSSAQIGYMLRLGLSDRIAGVGEAEYVVDSALYASVQSGTVVSVGNGPTLSLEKLVALKPDLVMNFATGGEYDDYQRIGALGMPLMLTSEWQEEDPLAKLEWIKLYGKLFGVESRADSIFRQSKAAYLQAASSASNAPDSSRAPDSPCPRVLVGSSYGGIWHAPGGNSYTARLIKAAGGCYLWASDTSREISMDLEQVLLASDEADVWINPGVYSTPEEITTAEPRAAYMKPFKNRRVCQNDGRKGPAGGNDFYESAVAYPAEVVESLRKCLNNATKQPQSGAGAFDWYRNIFIF